MFWLGDAREIGWKFVKYLPLEIKAGLRDNIPICCIFTYVLCILLSLLTKRDKKVFEFIYKDYRDFLETGYWRCPLCKWRHKVNKIRWDTRGYS